MLVSQMPQTIQIDLWLLLVLFDLVDGRPDFGVLRKLEVRGAVHGVFGGLL